MIHLHSYHKVFKEQFGKKIKCTTAMIRSDCRHKKRRSIVHACLKHYFLYLDKFVAPMNIYAKILISNESPMLCDMSEMNFSNLKKVIG